MTAPDLAPCPFCGARSRLETVRSEKITDELIPYWITCLVCAANGPAAATEAHAKGAWNTRPALSSPSVEELRRDAIAVLEKDERIAPWLRKEIGCLRSLKEKDDA